MAALLEVKNLTVRFPRVEAVSELGFSVDEAETVALVGESGSGKSMTALALMGLVPPPGRIASGSIRLQGRELAHLPETEWRPLRGRDIAMIFQEPMTSLNPVLSIGEQIIETLRLHQGLNKRQARHRAIELLDLVRIADPRTRIDDFPHRLSGGMRQRVMIAMAIACRPRLLIADEPTTALDVTIQAQVIDLLDRLRRELRMALLLITHDLALVGQWADKVVVMYAGRKVEEAVPDALFERPLHPYTRGLLGASPRLSEASHYRNGPLLEIAGNMASARGEPGCPFVPRCDFSMASCSLAVPPLLAAGAQRQVACPIFV